MINKADIDKIFESVRVEEVVGDYVTLKKRGANMIGLCPFHDEKTPSFYVSPAKGIYKCFGCGKGGNGVNFVMEKESMAYPDALRLLAKKYNVEIVEEEQTPEQIETQNERESLFVVSSFAQKNFFENLHKTDEGKTIALSYFKERGFREDIIEKFQLGYSINQRKAFTDEALKQGHSLDTLAKAGLTIDYNKNQSDAPKQGAYADRFWGRVMFPIHNVTGRVIAFGGRTLSSEKKTAKYINSPETDIYHKSDVLYGIYFAKKDIINKDNCFLVEGYTDVVSMHQAGVENVVASSGTSLTVGQIKLIRRFTKNITILYDGDSAGIKASFRGIDLILKEGLNVRVLLFPDGEDPDSYSKKVGNVVLQDFIDKNTQDFIRFKINLLLDDAKNDPIKRAGLIKDIVASIALIPDNINRSVYVNECSQLMGMEEQLLLNEVNKGRNIHVNEERRKQSQQNYQSQEEPPNDYIPPEYLDDLPPQKEQEAASLFEEQERKIIDLLINYGNKIVKVDGEEVDENGDHIPVEISVADYLLLELQGAEITLEQPLYNKIVEDYSDKLEKGLHVDVKYFVNHEDNDISQLAVNVISTPYALSERWMEHGIHTTKEDDDLKKSIIQYVYTLQDCKLKKSIAAIDLEIKNCTSDEKLMELLQTKLLLDKHKVQLNDHLGRIIVK